jgi:surface carbohydrate biosynthesis protein
VEEKEKTILVVSQGSITHRFVDIAKYLAKTLPEYTIIFKLHPGEVPFKDRYNELYKYKNIHIAKSGDIYRFIAESENIVACYSTTVFEAMGFNKKIFILDHKRSRDAIPKDMGLRFKTNIDLKELIKNTEKQETAYDISYYFNPDWEKNYKRFLEEKVDICL